MSLFSGMERWNGTMESREWNDHIYLSHFDNWYLLRLSPSTKKRQPVAVVSDHIWQWAILIIWTGLPRWTLVSTSIVQVTVLPLFEFIPSKARIIPLYTRDGRVCMASLRASKMSCSLCDSGLRSITGSKDVNQSEVPPRRKIAATMPQYHLIFQASWHTKQKKIVGKSLP